MTTNLFLLSTPMQLINVIEAKKHFGISNDSSVAIFFAYSANLTTINKILDKTEWREIYFIEDDFESQKKHEDSLKAGNYLAAIKKVKENYVKLKRLINQFQVVNNLFVGYYLGLENIHFVNSVKYERLILLDDGIATLEINRRRKDGISFLNAWSVEFLLKLLFKRFVLGYRILHPKSVVFFSSYNLVTAPQDLLEKNNYSSIRGLVGNKERTEEVYLLGQPLSEIKPVILTEETYFKYIGHICERFKSNEVIYFPHRDEDQSKLDRLRDSFDLRVKVLDIPIELYLLQQPTLPSYLIGFITSAIPNCKDIFGEGLKLFAIRINSGLIVSKSMLPLVEDTYEYFEKISDDNFKVINLID